MLTKNMSGAKNARRIRAYNRLKTDLKNYEAQIAAYSEQNPGNPDARYQVKRILREMATLEGKIVSPMVAAATRTKKDRGGMGAGKWR